MEPTTLTVSAITVICGLIGQAVKVSPLDSKYIPVIVGACGCALGIIGRFFIEGFPGENLFAAAAVGIVSGLAATGVHQACTQLRESENGDA